MLSFRQHIFGRPIGPGLRHPCGRGRRVQGLSPNSGRRLAAAIPQGVDAWPIAKAANLAAAAKVVAARVVAAKVVVAAGVRVDRAAAAADLVEGVKAVVAVAVRRVAKVVAAADLGVEAAVAGVATASPAVF
jgi:hypothetical protein